MLRIADYAQRRPQQSSFPCLSDLRRDRQTTRNEKAFFQKDPLRRTATKFLKEIFGALLMLLLKVARLKPSGERKGRTT
jgi:hypothetical protein